MKLQRLFGLSRLLFRLKVNYYLTVLTMSQNFIIRKNKSLKELGMHHKHQPALRECKPAQIKDHPNKHYQKMVYLEPLLKTKDTPYRQNKEKMEFKLDYTQPVNIKSITLANNHTREDPLHFGPIEVNVPDKRGYLQKENRPASMNEIKYPSIAKIKPCFYQTEKFESLKIFGQVNFNSEKEIQGRKFDAEERLKTNTQMFAKVKLLKQSSRSKLVKLYKEQGEIKVQPQLHRQKSFRKGIIDKIVNSKKKNCIENPNPGQAKRDATIKTQLTENSLEKRQKTEIFDSPPFKKDEAGYWGNCSTIKEQEESCQSFVSKNPFQGQEQSQKQNFETNFNEDKTIFNRRPKVKIEVDKIRKKFPHNFFK